MVRQRSELSVLSVSDSCSPFLGDRQILHHCSQATKSEELVLSMPRCEQILPGSLSGVCITVRNPRFFPDSLEFGPQIICLVDKPARRPGTPQIVSPDFNGSLAKAWLDACSRNHPECTIESDAQMPKTRLIDCVARKLVSAGDDAIQNPRFVALSYVWGPEVGTTTLTETLPSKLPLTIRDAITVTKDLGFQYLWVDQYCIDQSDSGDKDRQICHMDLIYKCADITIIAAAGYHCDYGLPGVSDCSRDTLDPFMLDEGLTFGIFPEIDDVRNHWKRGAWRTRGWTFQEAHLSRRRLVFSDTAMHFECMRYEECQTEMCGGVECASSDAVKERDSVQSVPERRRRDWSPGLVDINPIVGDSTFSRPAKLHEIFPQPVPHQNLEASIFSYTELVTQYTQRELTFASDGLNAFRGAANALAKFDPPVYSIAGIPFVVSDQGEDNLTEATFSQGLAWRTSIRGVSPDSNFPSWSWGDVRVWDVFWHGGDQDDAFPQLAANTIEHPRGVHIEFNTNGRKELVGLAEFGETCRYSTPLSRRNPTALCFRARILSSHVTSRKPKERKQNATWDFRGSGRRGGLQVGTGVGGVVNLVVNNTGRPSDEQSAKNGEAGQVGNSQPHCEIEIDELFTYEKIASGRCSLMLLRCNSIAARVLVVGWQDGPLEPQRTARRIGIMHFSTQRIHGEDHLGEFLGCFSKEIDIRLI